MDVCTMYVRRQAELEGISRLPTYEEGLFNGLCAGFCRLGSRQPRQPKLQVIRNSWMPPCSSTAGCAAPGRSRACFWRLPARP